MIRRFFCGVLLLALMVGAIGVQPRPVAAQAPVAPFANMLPADTVLYADVKTGDIPKTVDTVLNIVTQLGVPKPANPYQSIDEQLTLVLGRPASVQKDILPWVGDDLTLGYILSDADLQTLMSSMSGPSSSSSAQASQKGVAILAVKDQAAGDAFLKELLAKVAAMTTPDAATGKDITIGDKKATLYTLPQAQLVQAPGFYILGQTDAVTAVLSTVNDKKPSLNDDPNFGKTLALLKPNNLISVYVASRVYSVLMLSMQTMMAMRSTDLATPDPSVAQSMKMAADLFGAIQGQAMGFHIEGGKSVILDVVQNYDADKMQAAISAVYGPDFKMPTFPDLANKLADQIPDKALFSLVASGGLSSLYPEIKTALAAAAKMQPSGSAQAQQIQNGTAMVEGYLKSQFDMTPDDVFGWMTDEFGTYMTYNAKSVLNTLAKASSSSSSSSSSSTSYPFDHTFLIKAGDATKAQNFVTKLTAGLKKPNMKGQITVTDGPNGFVNLGSPMAGGDVLSYGLAGDTFVLTTSSGLASSYTAAIKGGPALSANTTYKAAQTNALSPLNDELFINFAEITNTVKAIVSADPSMNNSSTQQFLMAMSLLDSATLTAYQKTGTTLASIQINFK